LCVYCSILSPSWKIEDFSRGGGSATPPLLDTEQINGYNDGREHVHPQRSFSMTTQAHLPDPASGYQIDAESIAEMQRLGRQAGLLSEHLGLLPSNLQLEQKHTMLDVGCGPGEWALEVAQLFPKSQVMGIDIRERMIAYAHYAARERGLSNAQFQVMDALQPLAFPDASFDIIHTRFIRGILPIAMWPVLLGECFRMLRPGGIICDTEYEDLGITTSAALTQYNRLIGQCFAPAGDCYGITALQASLLQEAGFQRVRSRRMS
jgi:SAM-dependent methyltransferase